MARVLTVEEEIKIAHEIFQMFKNKSLSIKDQINISEIVLKSLLGKKRKKNEEKM